MLPSAGPGFGLAAVVSLLIALLFVAASIAVIIAVVLLARLLRHRNGQPAGAWARERLMWTWVAALVASAVGGLVCLTVGMPSYGGMGGSASVVAAAPPVAAATGVAALIVGEFGWPKPVGTRRRAMLVERSVRRVVPRGLLWASSVLTVMFLAVLVAGGLTADRNGRTFTVEVGSGIHTAYRQGAPYPGWRSMGLAFLGVLLLAGLTVAAVARIAHRPAAVTDANLDLALRAVAAQRTLRLMSFGVGATCAGFALMAGGALADIGLNGWAGVGYAAAALVAALTIAIWIWPFARWPQPTTEPGAPPTDVPTTNVSGTRHA